MKVSEDKEDPEFENSDGEDMQPEAHNKLLNAVSQIYKKQRIEKPQRREPTTQISEFNLSNKTSENDGKLVDVSDLVNILNKRAIHHEIKKKVKTMQKKSKPLPKPMEKLYADKLRRQVGYLNVTKQLNRWEAIVQRNRASDQLKFPLKASGKVVIKESHDFLKTFKEPTELEKEMAAILQTSETGQEEREKEEELFPLSLEEIIERRKMIAHMRARESYRIAKATRQNKIKSKKYHRILKRERMKKELKDFETLQQTNPEAALEKLEKIERARAEERITLRHRNTGKWARSRAIRAKYDTEARAQLAEQLAKSRELTRKNQAGLNSSSEGEEDENEPGVEILQTDPSNPWKPDSEQAESEITSFVTGFRKYLTEKSQEKNESSNIIKLSDNSLSPQSKKELDDSVSDSFNNSISRQIIDISGKDFIEVDQSKENKSHNNNNNNNGTSNDKINLEIISEREEEESKTGSEESLHDSEITSEVDQTGCEIVRNQNSSPPERFLNKKCDETKVDVSPKNSRIASENYSKGIEVLRCSAEPNVVEKKAINNQSTFISNENNGDCANSEKPTESELGMVSNHSINIEELNDLNLEKISSFCKNKRKSLSEASNDSVSLKILSKKCGKKQKNSSSNLKISRSSKKVEAIKLSEPPKTNNTSENSIILRESVQKKNSKLKTNIEPEMESALVNMKIKNKLRKNVKTQSGVWTVSTVVPDKKNNNINKKVGKNESHMKNTNNSIDKIFDNAENVLKRTLDSHIKQLKSNINSNDDEVAPPKSKKQKYHADLTLKSSNKRIDMDTTLIEVGNEGISSGNNDVKSLMDVYEAGKNIDDSKELSNIDPHKFLPVKPSKLNSGRLDLVEEQEESADEEENDKKRQLNLEEAFADDDVVEEFRREKEEEIENDKPKEIDLRLPGWGHWAGHDIDPEQTNNLKRKTRRLILKFPEIPRKDDRKDYVIINDDLPPTLKNQMVHDLPFPFKSVKDYETSIRAPVGNTWVPRSAFMKLIKPAVVTKMGAIIKPMNESELLHFEKRKFPKKKK